MTGSIQEIPIINTEDDAWHYLQLAIENKLPEGVLTLSFEEWPTVNIKLEGKQFDSSLTIKNMEGFIDLQKNIYHSYALARYGDDKKKLTAEEKDSLSVLVKVSSGSSGFQATLSEALKSFAIEMGKNMDPQSVIITVLGAGLLWAGTVCFKSWLAYLFKKKEAQLKEKDIESRQIVGDQEIKRMEIMAKAIKSQPILQPIKFISENTYQSLLKSCTEADNVHFAEEVLDSDTVEELVRNSRSKSTEVRLDGTYKIRKVDSSNVECFKVFVLNTETSQTFWAELQEKTVAIGRNKNLLQQAEWDRQPVSLEINAKEVKGEIHDAKIMGVTTETTE